MCIRDRFDAVADAGTIDLAANQPSVLEHLEVLRHGGLCQRQFLDNVAADAGILAHEQPKNLNAGGMPQRLSLIHI